METAVHKNIKFKFSIKRVDVGPALDYQSLMNGNSKKGSAQSEMGQLHCRAVVLPNGKRPSLAVHPQSKSSLTGNKREPLGIAEGHREKRQMIDMVMKEQCSALLRQLMSHKDGWIFNHPVDPVKLEIPDYFSIISKPMDLGTMRSNLGKNKYQVIEDFAADVRLTFANAMLYNPPSCRVHRAALCLSRSFEEKWKILNAKWDHASSKIGVKQISMRQMKETQYTCHKTPPLLKTKGSEGKFHHTPESAEECRIKSSSVPQTSKSDQDSDGAVSALDEESLCHSSLLMIPDKSTSIEGWKTPVFDVQLSPKKALRAAKLKSRFADTILKAQQKDLLDHGEKAGLAKLRQEKEKLERRQLEERSTIEGEIKAAIAAKRLRTESKLKMQRVREREAARIAVGKVVKTVELEENIKVIKELEMLGCSLYAATFLHNRGSCQVSHRQFNVRSPLEKLGLFIKQEYMISEDGDDDLDQAIETIEEGEIFS